MSINNFEQIINLKVKIITLLDQIIIGYIYTFTLSNEIIAIRITSNELKKQQIYTGDTYRILNTSFIKSIQVLPPFPSKKVPSTTGTTTGNGLPPYSTNNLLLTPLSINKFDKQLQKLIATYEKPQSNIIKASSSSPQTSTTTTTATASKKSPSSNKQHIIHHSLSHPHHQYRFTNPNTIAFRVYDRLAKVFGRENVELFKGDITLFDSEIKITPPYTLGKSNVHKLKPDSIHLDSLQLALKQFWLEIDQEKKGG
ncbi:uncharacterized protein J8A68_005864 [[Candida] subhashii]|uniref:LSM12 anticodon-binding domain-containing protein n=1 Tax=[Candida] subhashii TaxID=561895 RepID=A0A8J5QD66_9ASCO|nr:uncharacterized protein J8A68_005864 [[Candida] subhashii]KAG7660598.1 hypothetical protein J8A68_005864 [[Candida] subhashii]